MKCSNTPHFWLPLTRTGDLGVSVCLGVAAHQHLHPAPALWGEHFCHSLVPLPLFTALCSQCCKHSSGCTTAAALGDQGTLLAPIPTGTAPFPALKPLHFLFPSQAHQDSLWDVTVATFCVCGGEHAALPPDSKLPWSWLSSGSAPLSSPCTGQAQTGCGWAPSPATHFPP